MMRNSKREGPARKHTPPKTTKRQHHEDQDTQIDEPLPYSDPADLRNYISDS